MQCRKKAKAEIHTIVNYKRKINENAQEISANKYM